MPRMSCTSIDCSWASSARRACLVVHVPRPSVSTSQNLFRSVIRPYGRFNKYRAAPAKSSTPALRNRRAIGPSLDSALHERPTSPSFMTQLLSDRPQIAFAARHFDIVLFLAEIIVNSMSSSKRSLGTWRVRSEEHTSELQSRGHLVCRLLL